MFGAFFKRKGFALASPCLFFIFVLLVGQVAPGASAAPDSLVDRFLEQNQLMAISYLEGNLENMNEAIECLEDSSVCERKLLYSRMFGEDVGLEFTQDELISFVQQRHREYRTLIGIHSFHGIRAGLALGRGRMSITPVHGVRALIFNTNSEEGQAEWDNISSLAEAEFAALHEHSLFLNEAGVIDGPLRFNSMRKMLENQIHSYSQKFPFLLYMNRVESGLEQIIEAFTEVKAAYIESLTHIVGLRGDDRFELFGFVATIEEALNEFSPTEQRRIEEHFDYLEENNTLWNRILSIISNPKFLGLVACWTAALFVPPVGLICGAIGLTFSIPGLVNVVEQIGRLNDFMATGAYDHDVYTRYMTTAMVSAGLYLIVLRGSIPGFVTGVRKVHRQTRVSIKRYRLKGSRAFGSMRKIAQKEYEILKGYFNYYLKDISSNGVADLTLSNLGEASLKSLLPQVRSAFRVSLTRAARRDPSLLLYSDLLQTVKVAL